MSKIVLCVIFLSFFSAAAFAGAEESCAFFKTRDNGAAKYAACLKLFGTEISEDALKFTLAYLQRNLGQFADTSCALQDGFEDLKEQTYRKCIVDNATVLARRKRCGAEPEWEQIGRKEFFAKTPGLKNDCSFILNEVSKKFPKAEANRSVAYYVNLCEAGKEKPYMKFSLAKGSETIHLQEAANKFNKDNGRTVQSRAAYVDESEKKTTVLGAFVTGAIDRFEPFKTDAYAGIPRRERLRLALYGLNGTNFFTAGVKPIYTSPYPISWGAPSMDPEDVEILEDLAPRGPSLFMNYGPAVYHNLAKIDQCDNRNETPAKKAAPAPLPAPVKGETP